MPKTTGGLYNIIRQILIAVELLVKQRRRVISTAIPSSVFFSLSRGSICEILLWFQTQNADSSTEAPDPFGLGFMVKSYGLVFWKSCGSQFSLLNSFAPSHYVWLSPLIETNPLSDKRDSATTYTLNCNYHSVLIRRHSYPLKAVTVGLI